VTNRIYPDPKLCFNVARAYEGLGNSAGALRYYREYLRRTPSAAPTGPMSRPAFTAAFLEGAGVGEKAAGGVLPG
jgi:hypothetical protein